MVCPALGGARGGLPPAPVPRAHGDGSATRCAAGRAVTGGAAVGAAGHAPSAAAGRAALVADADDGECRERGGRGDRRARERRVEGAHADGGAHLEQSAAGHHRAARLSRHQPALPAARRALAHPAQPEARAHRTPSAASVRYFQTQPLYSNPLISSILILLLFPSIQLAGKGFRQMCHLFSFRTLHSSTFAPTK